MSDEQVTVNADDLEAVLDLIEGEFGAPSPGTARQRLVEALARPEENP